jgi:hypothetical protein
MKTEANETNFSLEVGISFSLDHWIFISLKKLLTNPLQEKMFKFWMGRASERRGIVG